jgi:hypothetical protein
MLVRVLVEHAELAFDPLQYYSTDYLLVEAMRQHAQELSRYNVGTQCDMRVVVVDDSAAWHGEWVVAGSGAWNVLMPGYCHRIVLTDKCPWWGMVDEGAVSGVVSNGHSAAVSSKYSTP